MNKDNVVQFPKPYAGNREEVTLEEIESNLNMIKHYHIQETIATIAPMIFNHLNVAGFEFDDEDGDIKDGAFLIESLRSLMCKYYGIHHPFQIVSDSAFHPDDEDPGTLKIADSINVELKKLETV